MSREYRQQFADPLGGIIFDPTGARLLAQAFGAPTNSIPGYQPGCIYQDLTNAVAYINAGTLASSTFVAMQSSTTGTFTTVVSTAYNASAAAATFTIKSNTASALGITDGTTVGLTVDTRNTIANVSNFLFTAFAPTIATAAAAHLNPTVQIGAKTITYTGTNTVTSSLGVGLHIGIPTFTDASAGTLSLASNLHVAAVANAGGSLTLTASRMISTGVTDCYLTNAGVWTDTACWGYGKKLLDRGIEKTNLLIDTVLDKLRPTAWQYRDVMPIPTLQEDGSRGVQHMPIDDRGRDRVGIVYDDLPEELRAPGEEKGVSVGVLVSFALAALKQLRDRNADLEARLAKLEAA